VNLGFVGAVIIGSIQRVLHGAARALRATPASRNRVASLVLLVLAQLMARPLQSSIGLAGLTREYNRGYTYYQRSYSYALHSRLGQTAQAQGYLRRFQLMRLLDWCSIGASLRVLRLRLLLSGCADGPKSYDVYLFTYPTHFPTDLSLRAKQLSKTLVP
jgi:hypothetical protein